MYFIIGLLVFPAILVGIKTFFPWFYQRLLLAGLPTLNKEIADQNQYVHAISQELKHSKDQVNYCLKLIDSLGYTLHHMDDTSSGNLALSHSWKVRYFVVIGVFLQRVHTINNGSSLSTSLVDKPFSQWLSKSDGYYNPCGLKDLINLFPGFENRTLYDVIDLLYGLIHGNTEADLDAYLKKYIGLRLPGQPLDLATERNRWA